MTGFYLGKVNMADVEIPPNTTFLCLLPLFISFLPCFGCAAHIIPLGWHLEDGVVYVGP